jgi:hypothetical protein
MKPEITGKLMLADIRKLTSRSMLNAFVSLPPRIYFISLSLNPFALAGP